MPVYQSLASKLALEYDRVGDILHVRNCAPYPEQETEQLDDDVFARLNPQTGQVEGLEILFFSAWLRDGALCELPVTAELYPAT